MRHLAILLLAYAMFVLELSTGPLPGRPWLGEWHVGNVAFLYIGAWLVAWHVSPGAAAVWGGLFGLLADAGASSLMGVETVLVSVIAWALCRVKAAWRLESLLSFVVAALAATAFTTIIAAVASGALLTADEGPAELLLPLAAHAFLTALVGLALLAATRWIGAARSRPAAVR